MLLNKSILIKDIINYCGKKVYNKAHEYLKTDAFFIKYIDILTLKAFCETTTDRFKVSVSFNAKLNSIKIIDSTCTCSATGGPCEHIAALLLIWHHNPKSFKNKRDFAKSLKIKKKEDLVNLIEKMVDYCCQNKSVLHGIS